MPYSPGLKFVNHSTYSSGDDIIADAHEFIPNKLYFTSLPSTPQQHPDIHFFSTDHLLVYVNFYADFGPLNMGHVMKFCFMLSEKLKNPLFANKKICYYSSTDKVKRNNAAFLISSFMISAFKRNPEEAYAPFTKKLPNPPFLSYRDAGYGPATYFLSILDCLKGLYKGLTVGLLQLPDFDMEEYEFYEKVENGDMNWLCPKFLALASPKDNSTILQQQQQRQLQFTSSQQQPSFSSYTSTLFSTFNQQYSTKLMAAKTIQTSQGQICKSAYVMADLIEYMKKKNCGTIVRLNNNVYDREKFIESSIEHVELYFPDGSTPPDGILKRFLDLCESRHGSIAVHCKAGLGRTGSLIGAYLMKHYKMTASETISYLRIMRPGSVVGPQQNWLESMQQKLWKLHPSSPLPTSISLLKPSTFYVQVFDIPQIERYFSDLYQQPSNSQEQLGSANDVEIEDDDHEEFYEAIDHPIQPTMFQPKKSTRKASQIAAANIKKSAAHVKNSGRGSNKASTINSGRSLNSDDMEVDTESETFVLDEYSIPIQPRKGGKRGVIDEELFKTKNETQIYTQEYYNQSEAPRYQAYLSASTSISSHIGPNINSAMIHVNGKSKNTTTNLERNGREVGNGRG